MMQSNSTDIEELDRIMELLGGEAILGSPVCGLLGVHDLLLRGLPAAALGHLLGKLVVIGKAASLDAALGKVGQAVQCRKGAPGKRLTWEYGGRIWVLAETLVRATAVFGSQEQAELWLVTPALALGQRRPIDLLATPVGVSLVTALLGQIEYSVYS